MAFDYTNLYPDTSGNGGFTKTWNYTTVTDSIATCSAVGYFNKVATRVGIGDNIVVAQVDAFDKTRTTLIDKAILFVTAISNGVVTTALYSAPIPDSAALTGTPTAPTAAADTSSTQIATTAFVLGQAGSATPVADGAAAVGTSTRYARQDHVHPTDASRAPLASPALTGTPTAPTASPATNTTQIATTAYADAIAALKANIASPTFTGTPAAPTAAVDTNTTQLATTAMVIAQAAAATPLINGTAAVGTSTRFARGDHVHPTDTTRAPVASPTFTGTATATNNFVIDGAAATFRQMKFTTSGSQRFAFYVDNTAESGGNAGSNVNFNLFDDAGAFLSTPWTLTRSTGVTSFNITTASTNATTGGATFAGGVGVAKAIYAGNEICTGVYTVATLPAANAARQGARAFVTDANATTFLSTVVGGGANKVPVICDGTNWKIA